MHGRIFLLFATFVLLSIAAPLPEAEIRVSNDIAKRREVTNIGDVLLSVFRREPVTAALSIKFLSEEVKKAAPRAAPLAEIDAAAVETRSEDDNAEESIERRAKRPDGGWKRTQRGKGGWSKRVERPDGGWKRTQRGKGGWSKRVERPDGGWKRTQRGKGGWSK